MLQGFYKNQIAIKEYYDKNQEEFDELPFPDMQVIEALIEALAPFHDNTLLASPAKSAITDVPTYASTLLTKLQQNKPSTPLRIIQMKDLVASVQNRFTWIFNTDNIIGRSTLFHPDRTKIKFLTEKAVNDGWETIKLEKLINWGGEKKKKDFVESQIDYIRYCLETTFDQEGLETDDVLLFWKSWKTGSTLNDIARKYLCIPPTSVPSERAFSDLNLVYNEKRANLDPETTEKILFIRENYEYLPKQEELATIISNME